MLCKPPYQVLSVGSSWKAILNGPSILKLKPDRGQFGCCVLSWDRIKSNQIVWLITIKLSLKLDLLAIEQINGTQLTDQLRKLSSYSVESVLNLTLSLHPIFVLHFSLRCQINSCYFPWMQPTSRPRNVCDAAVRTLARQQPRRSIW